MITEISPHTEQLVSLSRMEKRKKKKAEKLRKIKKLAVVCAAVILVCSIIAGAVFFLLTESKKSATAILPASVTDYREFDLSRFTDEETPKRIKEALATTTSDSSDKPAYLTDFSKLIVSTSEFFPAHDWMQPRLASGEWGDNRVDAYAVVDEGKARDYMESPECLTGFLAAYCDPAKHDVRNGWLLTGSVSGLEKTVKTGGSLSDNPTFSEQFISDDARATSVIGAWTRFGNVSSVLPLSIDRSFPADNMSSVFLSPTEKGLAVDGSLFKSEGEKHEIFAKKPISDSISNLPANSVMAISGANMDRSVKNMIADKESYINNDAGWKALRIALEKWGVKTDAELAQVFGKTTSFSLNGGTVGNGIAGTMRITEGDKNKALSILNQAAANDKGVVSMYTLKEDHQDFIIESHSPKTDGRLTDNPLFNELLGNMENTVAAAYVDFDSTKDLLDSTYTAPEDKFDVGVVGINISNTDAGLDLAVKWNFKR